MITVCVCVCVCVCGAAKRRWWRDKVERKSVSAGERYSHFEVITDNEIKGSQGRQRLDGSRDPHDLRKKRDKILLERLRRPSGSRPGVSKVREMGVGSQLVDGTVLILLTDLQVVHNVHDMYVTMESGVWYV